MKIFEIKESDRSHLCSKVQDAMYLLEEIEESLKDIQSDKRDHYKDSEDLMYRDYRSYRR